MATRHIKDSPAVARRAERFTDTGLGVYDALHIASAEIGGADVFLTTDDRLIRAVRRADIVRLGVANPLEWLGGWNNENDP
jgi:predicted nucleic acid-binding protein